MQNSFSDQCPSFRYLRIIIIADLFGLCVILLFYGHNNVICTVGILLALLLMAAMVTKAAIMVTMPMFMTKMMAAMVVMRLAIDGSASRLRPRRANGQL